MSVEFSKPLRVTGTPIPGVVVMDLTVHGDNRGWFKENWQRAKMRAAGLPDFGPVQNNISFNETTGTTRGFHAEPWDKFISIGSGRVFGAWIDLRAGESFGQVYTTELDASKAIFVPRGVANAFQTLEDNTVYTYLVNDHWSAEGQEQYAFVNLADPEANVDWPIPLEDAEFSQKDREHPFLAEVRPMQPRKALVLGANGQLGRALRQALEPDASAEFATREDLELGPDLASSRHWRDYGLIINAAAYTAVDAAETPEGRPRAWETNVAGTAALAKIAAEHGTTLVHVSSDYVFDGTAAGAHTEEEPFSPLGVYGQTKAAGDAVVMTVPRHYIVRTSWVIGDGANFVRTMASLAERGIAPSVVSDQTGRLTFAQDLAQAILHLVRTGAPYGTYNASNDGEPQSWAEIAADVYQLTGHDRNAVTGVRTSEYFAGKAAAPRPLNSALDLSKLKAAGFRPPPMRARLEEYLRS
jgi:dTDP-4-dehydrorhamnose reductase/dTDP-4-dehydrorhamnose 3,5-epimerase